MVIFIVYCCYCCYCCYFINYLFKKNFIDCYYFSFRKYFINSQILNYYYSKDLKTNKIVLIVSKAVEVAIN